MEAEVTRYGFHTESRMLAQREKTEVARPRFSTNCSSSKKVVHTSFPLAVDLGYNLRCQGGIQL